MGCFPLKNHPYGTSKGFPGLYCTVGAQLPVWWGLRAAPDEIGMRYEYRLVPIELDARGAFDVAGCSFTAFGP